MIEKYTLDNGMTVLLEPIEGVVSVSVGFWVKTGSRNEQDPEMGYAHFIEHMLFKGTSNYSAKDIARMIDRVGGQHNAATNREYTCYYINVVFDYLELSIKLLADMYYNSLFDGEELEKEKNVILEEIRMYEDTPDELIHDIFMECMLHNHPLGHPILGTADSISATKMIPIPIPPNTSGINRFGKYGIPALSVEPYSMAPRTSTPPEMTRTRGGKTDTNCDDSASPMPIAIANGMNPIPARSGL